MLINPTGCHVTDNFEAMISIQAAPHGFIAAPGLIAQGTIDHLRRPIDDRVFFVNQDNWALPAVENCMLDAEIMTDQLRESLGG